MADRHLAGQVTDKQGRKIGVYQNRNGITLDLWITDRNLTMATATELMIALQEAISAAALWQADQEQAEREQAADAEA